MPVHDDEWDGDVPIAFQDKKGASKDPEDGKVVFKGDVLPWHVGLYEVRYHHDGKYNVMSLDGPIEIYGEQFVFSSRHLFAEFTSLFYYSRSPGNPRLSIDPLVSHPYRHSLLGLRPISCSLVLKTSRHTEVW